MSHSLDRVYLADCVAPRLISLVREKLCKFLYSSRQKKKNQINNNLHNSLLVRSEAHTHLFNVYLKYYMLWSGFWLNMKRRYNMWNNGKITALKVQHFLLCTHLDSQQRREKKKQIVLIWVNSGDKQTEVPCVKARQRDKEMNESTEPI